MINILLVEDHNIVRNGIKMLLEANEELKVIAEAVDGVDATHQLTKFNVNLVLVDINMPGLDGMELLKHIKSNYPEIQVIMLSMHNHEKYVIEAFDKGCNGYLLKNVGADELLFAIKMVHQGNKYICAELTFLLLEQVLKNKHHLLNAAQTDIDFSLRELEILQLIADGLTNQEMSEKLFLSKRTIEGHRQSLLDKTASKNSAALIRYGVLHGLIQ